MKNKLIWIYCVSALCYFIQGVEGLPSLSIFKYLKEVLLYPPEKIMILNSIIGLAWIPKIVWGILIDKFLTKKVWILFSLIIDILTVLFLGIWSLPLIIVITLMFLNSTNSAIRDVAVDGIMCVEGKKYKETGKIQSCQWVFITLAAIITGLLGGYLADHYSYQVAFLLLIPFYLLLLIPLYFYKEYKPKEKIKKLFNYKKLLTNKSFLITCLFLFLYKFSPSFGTPLSYLERDSFKWSFQFMGVLSTISSVISIFGAILYWKLCKKINIKKWLYYSVFLGVITTLSYLYYTQITAIIYLIIYSLVGMFIHLIIMDWMAKSSVSGLEASTFALLCGINNFAAGTASSFCGAWLYPVLGLSPLIILSALTSFLCLPLINKLKINES